MLLRLKPGNKLKVYYTVLYPILHFIAGIGLSVLIFIAYLLIGRSVEYFELVFILVLFARGILFLKVPYFILKENEIQILNRFARVYKRYYYSSLEDFQFEGSKLFVLKKGKLQKVKISKLFLSRKSWNELIMFIQRSDLKKELH